MDQSALLSVAAVKALNAYFPMPFRKSALITVTNEGEQPVASMEGASLLCLDLYKEFDLHTAGTLPEPAKLKQMRKEME